MRLPSLAKPFPCAAIAFICAAGQVHAQAQGGLSGPEPLTRDPARLMEVPLPGQVEEAPAETGRTRASAVDPGARLQLRLLQSKILNPRRTAAEGAPAFDTVWHRGYVDLAKPSTAQGLNLYSAPMILASPGETVRIDLYNHMLPAANLTPKLAIEYLPLDVTYNRLMPPDECNHTPATMNKPDEFKCYNATNLHFHGGWVSPAGNSDNVLRELHPSGSRVHEYEYNIPSDHPAGTFWYHPHVHGATAIQVGSGMAGPLIIKGDRWPETGPDGWRAGDIDVLLKKANGSPIPDRLFFLQQIHYDCRYRADGTLKTRTPDALLPPSQAADPANNYWTCAADEIGSIDDYQFLGGPNWGRSERFTTVNGHVADVLTETVPINATAPVPVVAGQPERWRLVHAGFNDSINVQIVRRKTTGEFAPEELSPGTATLFERTPANEEQAVIERACEVGEPLGFFEIAADGLTRPSALSIDYRPLQPGYRSDILVSFPAPAEGAAFDEYCVIDTPLDELQNVEGSVVEQRLLFTVRVQPAPEGTTVLPAGDAIAKMLTDALQHAPAEVDTGEIAADLQNDLTLTRFSPHGSLVTDKDGAPRSVDNYRFIQFNLTSARQTDSPAPVNDGAGIGYAWLAADDFDGTAPAMASARFSQRPDEMIALQLGDVDEWHLTVDPIDRVPAAHPFHIHVNPFEVVRVTKTITLDGVEQTIDLTEVEEYTQDAAQAGDPLVTTVSQYFGMKGVFKDTIIVEPNVEVVIRSHYERYVGRFVMHCHILAHEDAGMMRLIEIFDPARPGGLVAIEESLQQSAASLHGGTH